MAKQTINLGTAPTGAGGDTFRSGSAKLQANDDEIYNYLGDGVNLNKLGTAASKDAGTGAGNVMEVGAFGLGGDAPIASINNIKNNGFYNNRDPISNSYQWGNYIEVSGGGGGGQIYFGAVESNLIYARTRWGESWAPMRLLLHTGNTATDANGFIKAASPIVKLFADKIEINDEAKQQDISFEKLGVGDYLIKGSSGFAQEGWYIETPKDANGNVLFSVIYHTLENGDISVKTYKKKFDFETVSIVADLDNPVDITENRWIDLRLQELPQPEIEESESVATPEFQPTGLTEAVATVMESYHDPEQ
ncbi:phage tail protein [Acinetobacter johnsonii]|uniref:phage tail fiber protein n=1 Tax=Acinetobacter johnsonii TaxID=40214 RepID=UPI00244BED5E|nr:phage tail protein [Acinetobacter johnsonii]MDH1534099.1 phage tail protein [Acinetobacter johnsonii]